MAAINFDKFAQEGNAFLNQLAADLGHADDKNQTAILLRSSLHVLRDRITISESFHLLAQLPMFLKALYVEQWKYREYPLVIESLEEFEREVEKEQAKFGETRFDWQESTADIVRTIFNSLGRYWSEGEIEDVLTQLPLSLKPLFEGNRGNQSAGAGR